MKRIRFSLRTLLILAALAAVLCVPLRSQLRSDAAISNLQRCGASPVYIRTAADGTMTPYIGAAKPFDTWHTDIRAAVLGRSAVDALDFIVFTDNSLDMKMFQDAILDLRSVKGLNRIQLMGTTLTAGEAEDALAAAGLSRIAVDD